jgi:hypothetical protein
MSYTINKTTGEVLITLQDGTADGPDINSGSNVSDIDLFGKNYPYYGQYLDENFIKLLQNFANVTPPTKPLQGELWFDISTAGNHILRIYDGTSWLPVTPVWSSATAPTTTQVGAQWWDSTNSQLNMYNGSGWSLVGPAYSAVSGKSGSLVETVTDTLGGTHTVVKFYSQNNVAAIISYDQSFTLNASSAVTGFSVISPGITLSTEANNLLYGTAVNAQQLGNVVAANYARTDIDSVHYGNVTVGNQNLVISAKSLGESSFINTVLAGNIAFYANVSNVKSKVLNINGLTGEVTVNQDPTNPLGVASKHYVDVSIATATAPLATLLNPALTGVPTAPNVAATVNTNQIATMNSVQSAISSASAAPWLGSNKTVSTSAPVNGIGNAGDFWFQI